MTRSMPARYCLSLLLLASLLAFPAAWASGEEVREQGATAKPEEKEAGDPGAPTTGNDRSTESADDETDDETTEPSVNTLEEIVACRDLPAALGTPHAAPAPRVVWREVAPRLTPGQG